MQEYFGINSREETELMLLVANNSSSAFTKLYLRYFPIVVDYLTSCYLHRSMVDDLAQEVFVRVWKNRAKYSPDANVKTYLLGYAKNILREQKSKSFIAMHDISDFLSLPSRLPSVDVMCQNNEIIEHVKKAIERLPDKQKITCRLIYISGYSVAQTAKALNSSPECIYSHLSRARKRLRKLITGCISKGISER